MVSEIPASLILSIVITILVFAASVWIITHLTVRKLGKRLLFSMITVAALLGWFVLVAVLGKAQFFAANPFVAPHIIFAFLVLFILLRRAYFSPTIQAVADAMPVHWMIAIQTYRVVGVGFINLYTLGLLPAAFAFPAGYGDIFIGVTAPFVAYLYFKKKSYSRKLAVAWNIIGIADLVIAISVGILGYPRPLQMLPTNPSTELLSLFPLVLIPLFAVPLAFMLHLFSLRILMKKAG